MMNVYGINQIDLNSLKMDGKYDHNIEIPMTFTYNVEPKSIWNLNEYNGEGPAAKTNPLNHFKDPLEACVVAGGLNWELISYLTFNLNTLVVN